MTYPGRHSVRTYFGMNWVAATVILLAGFSVSWAQLPTATILGVVKDSTGAVVPGAALTARNTETGQTRSTVSEADGSYRFAALRSWNSAPTFSIFLTSSILPLPC